MELTIGKKIQLFRIAIGLHQDEFGRRAGLSPFTIHNYENEKTNPNPEKVKQIEATYNIDLDSFDIVYGPAQ